MDDLLSEFLAESSENLSIVDGQLATFEHDPSDSESLGNIFRLLHTIKGTCGFLGLPRLESVAHAGENVLGKFRDGGPRMTPEAVRLILECIDVIRDLLGELEETGSEPEGQDADIIKALNAVAEGGAAAEKTQREAREAVPEPAPTPEKAKVPALSAGKTPAKDEKESRLPKGAAQTLPVNVEALENLMTLVGEMVLSRNQLMGMVRGRDDSEFTTPLRRLSLITTKLHDGVMKTRMQPIGNAWSKLPRIVRDLSEEAGKKVELLMGGAETELDRRVLELIGDPLTHMVRYSAEHGLESPADRLAAGKPETGKISLNAFHEGGHMVIEIADDGRGLGMDVVGTKIEKIGGTIELNSVTGRGSTFTIKIPLTLDIVSALIVECAGQRFAVPRISVVELVRASPHSEHTIEMINESPVLRLRNRLLPLVSLGGLLKLGNGDAGARGNGGTAPVAEAAAPANQWDELFIVVTRVGTYTFGIIVDRVLDIEEIVVKPVASILDDIPFYSGTTILGDGSVIMILDANGIATAAGRGAVSSAPAQAVAESAQGDETTSLLIFRAGGKELKGVPLALIARIEEIDMAAAEISQGSHVVQYRGHRMPLVPVDPDHEWKTQGRQPILVFTERNRSVGLVVDEIVDIVEERVKIEVSAQGDGHIGSAVIDGKATGILDAGSYLTQAFPDWFATAGEAAGGEGGAALRVLLVDDSPFFRNLLAPLLSVAGYDVTTADNAGAALDMREAGVAFDAIISDIEMPGMDGIEFAEAVRGDPRWGDVPMVALSSHATEKDIERGRQVGFNGYVEKFDREALIDTLARTVLGLTLAR